MTKLVDSFIENVQEPVTVQLSDTFSGALEKMLENDFSQLPVVDEQNKPIGFVTYQSITRTLLYQKTPFDKLYVSDIYEETDKTQVFRGDETLSHRLDRLRSSNAILFIDAQDKLVGIFTASDATEYLRARAENLLYVQDIESTIKDLLRYIFQQAEDEPDNENLRRAIRNVTQSNLVSKKEYGKALRHYLEITSSGEVDQVALAKSYDELFGEPTEIKPFSKLTFGDFIALLLHKDQQSHFEQLFKRSPDDLRKLLEDVRDTRNDLAHLREITSIQRDQLFRCKKLLDRIVIPADWQKSVQQTPEDDLQEHPGDYVKDATPIARTDEESRPGESRYSPLADWLNSQPGGTEVVQLSFEQIEKLIGGPLPASASEHRAWWANDSQGHPHSQLWLEVGWRVGYRNIAGKIITFVRMKEREKAYVNFFGPLLHQLRGDGRVPVREETSPDGSSWMVVVQETQSISFTFAFTRGKRFRDEMYIDTGDQKTTKQIFDHLYEQKDVIEASIGHLSWERLDTKRASRIAWYHDGHITDPEKKLEDLRQWAVESMAKLYSTLSPLLQEATSQVL
jgi:CBS domain-containing protein